MVQETQYESEQNEPGAEQAVGETPEAGSPETQPEPQDTKAVASEAQPEAVADSAAAPESDEAATADPQASEAPEEPSAGEAETQQEPAAVSEETPEPLTPLEQFMASKELLFIAPDVPPIQPRSRRSEAIDLDELLDRETQSSENDATSRRTRNRSGRRSPQDSQRADEQPQQPQRQERKQAAPVSEPQRLKGSTRLEAKKQRRREGREAGRRRTVITESEFQARRESVDRQMIVRSLDDRIQIGVLEDNVLVEHYVARSSETSLIGNVYLGKVQNVLPSMEAAFVDIGRGRNAVLYSGEVDWSSFDGAQSARKIENVLSPGDKVLVQVTKDPVGHKGARLTSQVSLPGRFLVYVPGGAMNGISRKLPDTERARLKKILKEVLPDGAGVIVRTAAEGASEDHLTLDVQRLTKQWESIQERSKKDNAPSLLHSESDMLIKIVRDVFNEDFQKMIISGNDTYGVISRYLEQVAPELCERLEHYQDERDIFDRYRISEQISKALDRKVWLPSGGSLVIDRTEAMTVVDVNTGKFVGSGGNLEETVTKNNLEAAEEIVRQLRLRDIGGIIVVDFIDMVLESNRDLVLRRMVECLSRDRTKHQVAEVTSLGLVQMTRKKLGLGLLESFSEPCEICAGRGLIVHQEPVHRETQHRSSGKRGKQQNHQQQQQQQQQSQQQSQPHAISDGAKNMLAQVAASTIAPSAEGEQAAEAPATKPRRARAKSQQSQKRAQAAQKAEASQGEQQPSGADHGARNEQAADIAAAVQQAFTAPKTVDRAAAAAPKDLLDSVLNALPDAPETGESRLCSRRATRRQQGVDPKQLFTELEDQ
ncbi:Rne/Rng family ribonuclease [Leucobacter sp. UCMA 4100]|uniref:Rne/Rng family ribonuclease n=1 Tax=Leucobacter sp. UCMA 4100 TaxID=2810534 RepID=UPI0022EB40DD|nr:Rne/Rng family ribonuclease [Leucobacter sp. UCMA 4100]MDA3148152.1 Rne/Rng family ribonuclease [Leucobacter sp. UCMA 4100]